MKSVNTALISLLMKKDKSTILCSSFHLLSLIHSNVKAFSKVLTHCLNKYLARLVNGIQTGFARGHLAPDILRILLHMIHSAPDSNGSPAILTLDTEKAFDRLEWEYL